MDTDCGDHPSSQAYDLPLMAGAIAILRAVPAWRVATGSPALPEVCYCGMGGTLLSPALQGQQYCGLGHGRLLVRVVVVVVEQEKWTVAIHFPCCFSLYTLNSTK
jgi:hypothetical protein